MARRWLCLEHNGQEKSREKKSPWGGAGWRSQHCSVWQVSVRAKAFSLCEGRSRRGMGNGGMTRTTSSFKRLSVIAVRREQIIRWQGQSKRWVSRQLQARHAKEDSLYTSKVAHAVRWLQECRKESNLSAWIPVSEFSPLFKSHMARQKTIYMY